jgi:hypothetical protein
MSISRLKIIVEREMRQVPEVVDYCNRCLDTGRWDGSILLMIVDCSFTSIGLSYFHSVVPGVERFRKQFLDTGRMHNLDDLPGADENDLRNLWKNKRSWIMGKAIASHFAILKRENDLNDRATLRHWAKSASLDDWRADPIGAVTGVGINSYQYLRMMGGVNTVMPDKIVKRVINGLLIEAGEKVPQTDIDFVKTVEDLGPILGYRAIELCWMTWLVQSEADVIHMQKHKEILSRI